MKNEVDIRTLVIRLMVVLTALFFVVVVLSITVREPIEAFAQLSVERYGVLGLFLAVLCVDSIPGLTNEPLLLLAVSGGLGFGPILFSVGIASVLAGCVGWLIGGRLRRFRLLQEQVKAQGIEAFFDRYGGRTVALAALLPIPFALTTWAAGAAGLEFRTLFLGSCWRIPKTCFYLTLIYFGWSAGS